MDDLSMIEFQFSDLLVCEKVFLGRPIVGDGNDVDLIFKENGILVSKHGCHKLKELLKTCSNPSTSKDAVKLEIKCLMEDADNA